MTARGNRITCAATAALSLVIAASCAGPGPRMPGAVATAEGTVRVRVGARITTVPLEQYVVATALSEITPTGERAEVVARVYDVQTVLARTYALSHLGRHAREGFDLCDQTHCQVYQPDRVRTSRFAEAAQAAARRTRGQVLRMGRTVIDAVFHADCGGHTTTPSAAWGGTDLAYLPARPDDAPDVQHRTWTFEGTLDQWREWLNSDRRTAVGQRLTGLRVTRTGPGERVLTVRLEGSTARDVSGEVLRAVISNVRGPRSVMSTRFIASSTATGIRLVGSGYGHGVGLCQLGALARARRGDSLRSILEQYYPGARLGPSGPG